jgi:hypothetical protein
MSSDNDLLEKYLSMNIDKKMFINIKQLIDKGVKPSFNGSILYEYENPYLYELIKLLIDNGYEFEKFTLISIIEKSPLKIIELLITAHYFEKYSLFNDVISNTLISELECIRLLNNYNNIIYTIHDIIYSIEKEYFNLIILIIKKLNENNIKYNDRDSYIDEYLTIDIINKMVYDGHVSTLIIMMEYIRYYYSVLKNLIRSKLSDKDLIIILNNYKKNMFGIDYKNISDVLDYIKRNRSVEIINILSELISMKEKISNSKPKWKSFCPEIKFKEFPEIKHLGLYDLRKILNKVNISMVNDKSILELSKTEICDFLNSYDPKTYKVDLYTKKCHNENGDLIANDWEELGDNLIVQDPFGYCFSYYDIKQLRITCPTWPESVSTMDAIHPYTRVPMDDFITDMNDFNKFVRDVNDLYEKYEILEVV